MSQNSNRAEINRANSQKSTGPRTEAGKSRSAMNALKHGLTAKAILLPTEDPEAYQRHLDTFMNEFKPANAAELAQVKKLAHASWHMDRIARIEELLFSQFDEHKTLDSQMRALSTISMHHHRLSRDFDRTLKELRAAQHDRQKQHHRYLAEAAMLYSLDEDQGIEYDPAVDGFVFAKEEIESFLHRQQRKQDAVQHDLHPKRRRRTGERQRELALTYNLPTTSRARSAFIRVHRRLRIYAPKLSHSPRRSFSKALSRFSHHLLPTPHPRDAKRPYN